MSFRTVIINKRAKLETKLGYLVIREKEEEKIFLSEIDSLIIETPSVAITGMLLNEVVKRGINVIFCDEKHLPFSQLVSIYSNTNKNENISKQIKWNDKIKSLVWQEIIKEKIRLQAKNLALRNLTKQQNMLMDYYKKVEENDKTNREGHSAKVYFNSIFFDGFTRDADCCLNLALNYGYAILTSMITREIVNMGFLTEIGIWHCNDNNKFNFSSDLIEPFRPIVDYLVMLMEDDATDYKNHMKKLFLIKVKINNQEIFLSSAISIYIRRIINILNGEKVDVLQIENYILEKNEL
jgi:CRISP-associated protein Cas1